MKINYGGQKVKSLLPDEVSITARMRTLKWSAAHVTSNVGLKMCPLGEGLATVDIMTEVSVTVGTLLAVGTETWHSSSTRSASPSDLRRASVNSILY